MSFQRRLMLAMLLSIAVLYIYSWIFPPPPPESEKNDTIEGTPVSGVQDKGDHSDSDLGKTTNSNQNSDLLNKDNDSRGETLTKSVAEESYRIKNEKIALEVGNRSHGLLSDAEPLAKRFKGPGNGGKERGVDFLRLGDVDQGTWEIGFESKRSDVSFPTGVGEVIRREGNEFATRRRSESVEVIETIRLGDAFEAELMVQVRNLSTAEQQHRLRIVQRMGGADEDDGRYNIRRVLCASRDDVEDYAVGDLEDTHEELSGDIQWFAVDTKYFLSAIAAESGFTGCEAEGSEDRRSVEASAFGKTTRLGAGESVTHRFGIYIGPKNHDVLKAFETVENVGLERSIDWGFLSAVSKTLGLAMLWLLRAFHEMTGVWGVAIILLTVVVKVVTLPLTLKQYASMKKMRELQPQLEEIRKKYGDDRMKQSQETQALFARSGANPFAGCLPAIVQLPVWYALYAMIGGVVDLYQEPFLWLPDLTLPDRLYILPVAMSALMWLQMHIQPTTGDSQQAAVMKWVMPGVFLFMMLLLPSGLGVYMLANIVLSLVQSYIQLRPKGGSGSQSPAQTRGATS